MDAGAREEERSRMVARREKEREDEARGGKAVVYSRRESGPVA